MTQPFVSTNNDNKKPWLEEVYDGKKDRTYDIGKRTIDELVKRGERVSYRSIQTVSKTIDPTGKGVHANTVGSNEQLHQYYLQFAMPAKRSKIRANKSAPSSFKFEHLKPNRDLLQVRKRYMRLSRSELAEKLIQAEEYIAQNQLEWQKSIFELFK
ncbi:hypothetical protein [Paenibacillus sp. LHD-38]|uniref:hypothetical protein n=1 Tax=Paenibacillus sp. LHD-38 TaxID=3072143 RepID=UPI00280DFE12|nr:hypothetical protein [Paenibacillus sp. LHD-38]MDQ8738154.1 hypothetical protein [Paenibacillus sp. LHD-38]